MWSIATTILPPFVQIEVLPHHVFPVLGQTVPFNPEILHVGSTKMNMWLNQGQAANVSTNTRYVSSNPTTMLTPLTLFHANRALRLDR